MRAIACGLMLLYILALPASALELEAPPVPREGAQLMPADTDSFPQALGELLDKAIALLQPQWRQAADTAVSLVTIVFAVGMLTSAFAGCAPAAELMGAVLIARLLLADTDSMIRLAADTVTAISEYGKLLVPVLTAALAAQGGPTASAALYAGTLAFDTLLSTLVSGVLIRGVYFFLALSVGRSMLPEGTLKQLRDLIHRACAFVLKLLLTAYTGYMSLTGVVSGATDAAALKAAKMTISISVPVVGGILSDASEAVLVSAAIMKNAAGIYGILAVLSVFLEPFLRIGLQYLLLKLTGAVCGLSGVKRLSELIEDFSTAMGLLLAMTAISCLLVLISTVCFMKGVS